MGLFFKKSRTLESTEQEENAEEQSQSKGGFINGLLGLGKYAKTEEEKEEARLAGTLAVRLGDLKIKKYKDSRPPKYNKDKHRLEVGADFDFKTLPDLIYSIAKKSSVFRSRIGGRFDRRDREVLRYVIKHRRNRLRRMERQLNQRNEDYCVVSLSKLFS